MVEVHVRPALITRSYPISTSAELVITNNHTDLRCSLVDLAYWTVH